METSEKLLAFYNKTNKVQKHHLFSEEKLIFIKIKYPDKLSDNKQK